MFLFIFKWRKRQRKLGGNFLSNNSVLSSDSRFNHLHLSIMFIIFIYTHAYDPCKYALWFPTCQNIGLERTKIAANLYQVRSEYITPYFNY